MEPEDNLVTENSKVVNRFESIMFKNLPKILSGIFHLLCSSCTFPIALVLCSNVHTVAIKDDSTF